MKAGIDMPEQRETPKTPASTPGARKGERIVDDEGVEPGRRHTGKTGADRPAGSSTARDSTRVNPEDEDPVDPSSPKLPPA